MGDEEAPAFSRLAVDTESLSRAEFVYQKLWQGIQDGEFHSGQRLREAELALRLKVSRTPVREALRRLTSEGLIEFAPSRGMMIVELDKQQVRELYALRETLEGAAARFAAQHASPSEISALEELLERQDRTAMPSEEAARLNRRFHNAIHEAAHNRYLVLSLRQLYASLALLPGTTFTAPGRITSAREEHGTILMAIQDRDAMRAEAAARRHIENAGRIRMQMMFEG
ncbi:MAG: GntR family transcriptional regulator [Hyphomicrobiales bacterium]|nr:GntR family transcriptional regulator [Hyphomicrobiales bacterium]MBV9114678.1 GntR family transcriptional regulator [Hyphomicrobiales bacterium]MBV9518841.1 GntR family transcriptional regulator [Hyphomicrobiales bacterium]